MDSDESLKDFDVMSFTNIQEAMNFLLLKC